MVVILHKPKETGNLPWQEAHKLNFVLDSTLLTQLKVMQTKGRKATKTGISGAGATLEKPVCCKRRKYCADDRK
jgi:hypothetical protein